MEIAILDWLQANIVCPALTPVMSLITTLGNEGLIWVILIALLCIKKETRLFGAIAAVALALDVIFCNGILKPLIARPRPFTVTDIALLIEMPTGFSFPSGHTASSFAVATAICFWSRRWGIAALVLATLIAFSRLYFYVHYPTDVLAGVILGIACAFAARAIVRKAKAWKQGLP